MAETSVEPDVLIVEDDEELADLYSQQLASHYTVSTVNSGEEALDQLDRDFEVILLDRKLPDMSGEDLVEVCQEQNVETRIAMVTGVSPDFDIVEMPIDDYLLKPIEGGDLVDTVDKLFKTEAIDEKKLELSSKQVKRNVLQVEKRNDELMHSDEFKRLENRIHQLKTQIENLESNSAEPGKQA